ncbi:MAG: hypothetical protein EOO73_05370 [Myxococcales bacterium]|nr:MAG: hypothetical protein EOO73_05370 [Myxococcales bacterium]
MRNTETTAFSTFSPYLSFRDRVLSKLTLMLGETNTTAIRQRQFLHLAQFCPVSPDELKRAGLHGAGAKHGALLFMSYYNGSRGAYFDGFARYLWEQMNEVWRYCVAWELMEPPAGAVVTQNLAKVGAFIEKHERQSASFFNAYQEKSSSVLAVLLLRRAIDELRAASLDDNVSDAEFLDRFLSAQQSVQESKQ